ncbi:MAG: transcriptional regulator [Nannocystaceae bacterium]|nr:transcriptional regulator [bacterium]
MAERQPPPRGETIRDALRRQLRGGWVSARQLSTLVGISEKEVPAHLQHLQKSASGAGEDFQILPATCSKCGYAFEDRERLSKPSRCPACKGQRVEAPRFRIVASA